MKSRINLFVILRRLLATASLLAMTAVFLAPAAARGCVGCLKCLSACPRGLLRVSECPQWQFSIPTELAMIDDWMQAAKRREFNWNPTCKSRA